MIFRYTQTIKEVGMIMFCQRKRQMHCLWVGKRPFGRILLLYNLMIIQFSSFGSTTDFFNWNFFQKSADMGQNIINGRWRHWLVQWVDTQITKSRELEYLDLALTSTLRQRYDYRRKQLHHRRQCSLRDHNSLLSSHVVPTYINATESTKAKAGSMNSPKIRPGNFNT